MSFRSLLVASLVPLFWLVVTAGRASAQDPGPAPGPPAAEPAPPAPPPPSPAPPAGAGEATYHSPMRTSCEDELAKDKDWFVNLKDRLAGALYADHQAYETALKAYEAGKAQGAKPTPPPTPPWFADLTERMNRDVHEDAAHYATQNNKHVFYAYTVFWLLTAGFVVVMWRRQRALKGELTRLEGELAKAIKEGGAA